MKTPCRLLVSDTAPLYPPLWGGPRRIWNLFGTLPADSFEVTYVGVKAGFASDVHYFFDRPAANLRQMLCALPPHYRFWNAAERCLFAHTSVDLFIYLQMKTDWHFRYLLQVYPADVVVCSHPWSWPAIKKDRSRVFIYDAHNCEYLLMKQILARHPLRSSVLARVRGIEKETCGRSDLIFACSEKEKKDFCDLYRIKPDKIVLIPNGTTAVPETDSRMKAGHKRSFSLAEDANVVLFVGAYYKPNIDAARYIVETLAPALPEYTFMIIGTVKDHFREASLPKNVLLTGWLDDERLEAAFCAADMAINPMFDGSGVNIKMLDYMAHGLPVVTTECGARGIDTDGHGPFVVSEIAGFPEALRGVAADPEASAAMARQARALVVSRYDWAAIRSQAQGHILAALQRKRSS